MYAGKKADAEEEVRVSSRFTAVKCVLLRKRGRILPDFAIERFLFMIRLVIVYFERAIYLLREHNAEELMRECHIAE